MFAGINVCAFETKPCSRGLIFAVSLGLVSCLGTWIMFAGYLFLRYKDGREIRQINPSQTLMNLQYFSLLETFDRRFKFYQIYYVVKEYHFTSVAHCRYLLSSIVFYFLPLAELQIATSRTAPASRTHWGRTGWSSVWRENWIPAGSLLSSVVLAGPGKIALRMPCWRLPSPRHWPVHLPHRYTDSNSVGYFLQTWDIVSHSPLKRPPYLPWSRGHTGEVAFSGREN